MDEDSTTSSCRRQQPPVITGSATVQPVVARTASSSTERRLRVFQQRLHAVVEAQPSRPKEPLVLYRWLARLGHVSSWQAARKWWEAESIPTQENLAFLAEALNTTPAYLRGESPEATSPAKELAQIWRDLPNEAARAEVLRYARYVLHSFVPPAPSPEPPSHTNTLTGTDVAGLLDKS